MACLSKDQIDFIRSDLKSRRVSRSFLFDEWVDHVCCDVEMLMNKGIPFKEAYHKVAGSNVDADVKSAHMDVQQFMNHRYVSIKKLLLFAFLVFAASWAINVQDTGAWVSLVSFLILGMVYLRISVDFFRKRLVHGINILLFIFSLFSFIGTISGILLIFLNRNYGLNTGGHGVDLTVFGWFFYSLVCLIYYSREYRTAIEKRELRRHGWFMILSAFNVFLASLSIASFPLYNLVRDYLFYLIVFILGFNVLVIIAMLVTRLMKNTLILSLVIGSFMIVFIHSPFRSMLPGGKPKMHRITLQFSPEENQTQKTLYISMYYEQFPDRPVTLPLNKSAENTYQINMPSYTYEGYLYYKVRTDSGDAKQYFSQPDGTDSIRLKVPDRTVYQLHGSLH